MLPQRVLSWDVRDINTFCHMSALSMISPPQTDSHPCVFQSQVTATWSLRASHLECPLPQDIPNGISEWSEIKSRSGFGRSGFAEDDLPSLSPKSGLVGSVFVSKDFADFENCPGRVLEVLFNPTQIIVMFLGENLSRDIFDDHPLEIPTHHHRCLSQCPCHFLHSATTRQNDTAFLERKLKASEVPLHVNPVSVLAANCGNYPTSC